MTRRVCCKILQFYLILSNYTVTITIRWLGHGDAGALQIAHCFSIFALAVFVSCVSAYQQYQDLQNLCVRMRKDGQSLFYFAANVHNFLVI